MSQVALPAGVALSMQWQTNRLAVLGERLTVLEPDTGKVWVDQPAPRGAHQVQWSHDTPNLFVATTTGALLEVDGASGQEVRRREFGPGACWVRVGHKGRLEVLREAGEILLWWEGKTEPEARYRTERPIVGPLDTQVEQSMHLERAGPDLLLVYPYPGEPVRIAPLRGVDAMHASVAGGINVLDRPQPDGNWRLRPVYPDHDGALYWFVQHELPVGDPIHGLMCGSSLDWLFVLGHRGVQVWSAPDRLSGRRPRYSEQSPCPASEVEVARLLAELVTPRPTVATVSIDGRWLAATGPDGGVVVGMKKLLKPHAKKPDLEDLHTMDALVGAVARWRFAAKSVDEAIRSQLYDRTHDLAWLAAAPAAVRVWCVTVHLEHFLGWDGLADTVDKYPDHVQMAADCYEALGFPAVAELYRTAMPWIPRLQADDEGAEKALNALGSRINAACRKAPPIRVAWLLANRDDFAAL